MVDASRSFLPWWSKKSLWGIVHVLIATAVANVLIATEQACLSLNSWHIAEIWPDQEFLSQSICLASVPIAVSILVVILSRAGRRSLIVLPLVTLAGWAVLIAVVLLLDLIYFPDALLITFGGWRPDNPQMYDVLTFAAILFPASVAGCYVAARAYAKLVGPIDNKTCAVAVVVGAVALTLGVVYYWNFDELLRPVVGRRFPRLLWYDAPHLFGRLVLVGIWQYAWIALALALFCKLLVAAGPSRGESAMA